MADANIIKIKIESQQEFVEEYCLCWCNSDVCSLALISPFQISDKVTKESLGISNHWCLVSKQDINEYTDSLKFESVYFKKGLVEDFIDQLFILDIIKSQKKNLTCFQSPLAKACKLFSIHMDGYALSLFFKYLRYSDKYVELVTNYLANKCYLFNFNAFQVLEVIIAGFQIKLIEPKKHVLDLTWAKMACTSVYELRQLQYAMSWLSTLGGACSALGEKQEKFALNAGRISIEQLRIALRLGDSIIVAQCKLYFSLSLIQRGRCQLAKKIIMEEYTKLKNHPVQDVKTIKMCHGIWARLKYEIYKRRLAKEKITN